MVWGTGTPTGDLALAQTLDWLAASAEDRDRDGLGLDPALARLQGVGALVARRAPGSGPDGQLADLRAVARADGSVGHVLANHLGASERLLGHLGTESPIAEDVGRLRRGELRAGIWGGAPTEAEGERVTLRRCASGLVADGVATFCTGAGHLDRAVVLARDPSMGSARAPANPLAAWIDVRDPVRVQIDTDWNRASGLRASASHRVVLRAAPVLGLLGGTAGYGAGASLAHDALRAAATWAGLGDRIVDAAIAEIRRAGRGPDAAGHRVGRMLAAQSTVGVWLEATGRAWGDPDVALGVLALHCRVAVAECVRRIMAEAERATGSHTRLVAGELDRACRDASLSLLRHRLDPGLDQVGQAAILASAVGAPEEPEPVSAPERRPAAAQLSPR